MINEESEFAKLKKEEPKRDEEEEKEELLKRADDKFDKDKEAEPDDEKAEEPEEKDGDEEKSTEIYYQKIMPYFAFYDSYPEELLKTMLHIRGVIDHPDIIPPKAKQPMSEIEWREFNWILDRIGFRKKWTEL